MSTSLSTNAASFPCVYCKEEFSTVKGIIEHEYSDHCSAEPILRCSICGFICADDSDLKIHEYTHTGKPLKCPFCIRTYISRSSYKAHVRDHKIRILRESENIVKERENALPLLKVQQSSVNNVELEFLPHIKQEYTSTPTHHYESTVDYNSNEKKKKKSIKLKIRRHNSGFETFLNTSSTDLSEQSESSECYSKLSSDISMDCRTTECYVKLTRCDSPNFTKILNDNQQYPSDVNDQHYPDDFYDNDYHYDNDYDQGFLNDNDEQALPNTDDDHQGLHDDNSNENFAGHTTDTDNQYSSDKSNDQQLPNGSHDQRSSDDKQNYMNSHETLQKESNSVFEQQEQVTIKTEQTDYDYSDTIEAQSLPVAGNSTPVSATNLENITNDAVGVLNEKKNHKQAIPPISPGLAIDVQRIVANLPAKDSFNIPDTSKSNEPDISVASLPVVDSVYSVGPSDPVLANEITNLRCIQCSVKFENQNDLTSHVCLNSHTESYSVKHKDSEPNKTMSTMPPQIPSKSANIAVPQLLSQLLTCPICSLQCPNNSNMEYHMKQVHSMIKHNVHSFPPNNGRKQSLTSDMNPSDCPICETKFSSEAKMTVHLKVEHGVSITHRVTDHIRPPSSFQPPDMFLKFHQSNSLRPTAFPQYALGMVPQNSLLPGSPRNLEHPQIVPRLPNQNEVRLICPESSGAVPHQALGSTVNSNATGKQKKDAMKQDMNLYTCKICQLVFTADSDIFIRQHLITGHGINLPPIYQCHVCKQVFPQKQPLEQHILQVHHLRCFGCAKCDLSFTRAEELAFHIAAMHSHLKSQAAPSEEPVQPSPDPPTIQSQFVLHPSGSSTVAYQPVNPSLSVPPHVFSGAQLLSHNFHKNTLTDQSNQLWPKTNHSLPNPLPISSKEVISNPSYLSPTGNAQNHSLRTTPQYIARESVGKQKEACHNPMRMQGQLRNALLGRSQIDLNDPLHSQQQSISTTATQNLLAAAQKATQSEGENHAVKGFFGRTITCRNDTTRMFACKWCQKTFHSPAALGGHMNVHSRTSTRMRQLMKRRRNSVPKQQENSITVQENSITVQQNNLTVSSNMYPALFSACDKLTIGAKSTEGQMLRHSCHICKSKYSTKEKLKEHLRVAHKVYKLQFYKCKTCLKKFKNPEKAVRHAQMCKKLCPVCPKTFRKSINRVVHKQHHKYFEKWQKKCQKCTLFFQTISSLKRHNLFWHSVRNVKTIYVCDECCSTFLNEKVFKLHRKNHTLSKARKGHTAQVEKMSSSAEKDKQNHSWPCDVCLKVYASKSSLLQHKAVHFQRNISDGSGAPSCLLEEGQRRRFKCPICGLRYATKLAYKTHIQKRHSEQFCCKVCNMACEGATHLQLHMQFAHDKCMSNLTFPCINCDQHFTNVTLLMNHEKEEHSMALLRCAICGSICNSAVDLVVHVQMHTVQAPSNRFKCPVCLKKWRRPSPFRQHIKVAHPAEVMEIAVKNELKRGSFIPHKKETRTDIRH